MRLRSTIDARRPLASKPAITHNKSKPDADMINSKVDRTVRPSIVIRTNCSCCFLSPIFFPTPFLVKRTYRVESSNNCKSARWWCWCGCWLSCVLLDEWMKGRQYICRYWCFPFSSGEAAAAAAIAWWRPKVGTPTSWDDDAESEEDGGYNVLREKH